jgi:RNA-directed DNA polymerase
MSEREEGKMRATTMAEGKSTKLGTVVERARDPSHVFLSLAYLIDEESLKRAYQCLREGAAIGIDGVSVELYGRELASNVRDLHQRMKAMRWRHQPIRRVHIPKEGGKTRPIGISCTEDKVVQEALRELLEVGSMWSLTSTASTAGCCST